MKQILLHRHKVYILNVQSESLHLQKFICYCPQRNINLTISLVQDTSRVVEQIFKKFLAIMEPKGSSPPFLAPVKANIPLQQSL